MTKYNSYVIINIESEVKRMTKWVRKMKNILCNIGIHICKRQYPTKYYGLQEGDLVVVPYMCSCGYKCEVGYRYVIPYDEVIKISKNHLTSNK